MFWGFQKWGACSVFQFDDGRLAFVVRFSFEMEFAELSYRPDCL
jgi:hypothetical protein